MTKHVQKKSKVRRPLKCELLEDRRVLATFMVTNSDAAGPGSLAQAVADANADAAIDDIVFDLFANALDQGSCAGRCVHGSQRVLG